MKKKILLITIFASALGLLAFTVVTVAPYYYYKEIIEGNYSSEWIHLRNYNLSYRFPLKPKKIIPSKNLRQNLWKKFHFVDAKIKVPVNNPYYLPSPIFRVNKNEVLGLALYSPQGRAITRLYFLKNRLMRNELKKQKMFNLPLVKKHLTTVDDITLWKDIFSKEINSWKVPFSEMVYNLYILHLRTRFLPASFKTFGLVENSSLAVIEVESNSPSYRIELVWKKIRGVVYGVKIVSEINNPESSKIRSQVLASLEIQEGSEDLGRIQYKYFKNLPRKDQTSLTGMLYLLSSWSHTPQKEFIRDMVYHLENGQSNQRQLKSLYEYAYRRYKKTFTTKHISGVNDTQEVRIKREEELEKIEELERLKYEPDPVERNVEEVIIKLSPEEEFQRKLQKLKNENKSKKSNQLIIN